MSRSISKSDGNYNFKCFLHLSPTDIRLTKTPSGSYSNERMCQVNISVPISAFVAPTFTIDIDFKPSSLDPDENYAEVIQDIDDALTALPVLVRVEPLNGKEG